MSYPSRDEILASSKGWVASFLNFLPGLGSGYLYQRRWKPYFFTITASTAWFALGIFLQGDSEPSQNELYKFQDNLKIISYKKTKFLFL